MHNIFNTIRKMEKFEREFIWQALLRNRGNISKTAEELGMYRQHLQLKLHELGVDASRLKGSGN